MDKRKRIKEQRMIHKTLQRIKIEEHESISLKRGGVLR